LPYNSVSQHRLQRVVSQSGYIVSYYKKTYENVKKMFTTSVIFDRPF